MLFRSNETKEIIEFIKKIANQYEPQIDSLMNKKYNEIKNGMFQDTTKNNRPLFTEETTKKILKNIEDKKQTITN